MSINGKKIWLCSSPLSLARVGLHLYNMTRIALESIPAITFYKDSLTAARRTAPIAQLVCLGKPCATYQPEVVRCRNIGGSGVNVDWKASNRTNFWLLYST